MSFRKPCHMPFRKLIPLLPLRIGCLNKTKAVKVSKLSQSETSETFSEFECIRNVLFTSKIQFLKVKSALKPGRIAVH